MAANDNGLAKWAIRRTGGEGAKAAQLAKVAAKASRSVAANTRAFGVNATTAPHIAAGHLRAAEAHKEAAGAAVAAGQHAAADKHLAAAHDHISKADDIARDAQGRFASK